MARKGRSRLRVAALWALSSLFLVPEVIHAAAGYSVKSYRAFAVLELTRFRGPLGLRTH